MSELLNFPHQVNRLEKIHAALQCVADLIAEKKNPLDDGLLGYLMARRGVYNFRGLESNNSLEEKIREEQKKQTSNQGPRTSARDIRRTLDLMGLIVLEASSLRLTPIAERIIRFSADSTDPEYQQLWKDALLKIQLGKFKIFPGKRILQLLNASNGKLEKTKLALAFLDLPQGPKLIDQLVQKTEPKNFKFFEAEKGITPYKIANSVKIIPALFAQLGLIRIEDGKCSILKSGQAVISKELGIVRSSFKQKKMSKTDFKPKKGFGGNSISSIRDIPSVSRNLNSDLEKKSILNALETLAKKTQLHQELLRALVKKLRNVSSRWASQQSYDLLAKSSLRKEWLLFECKTGLNLTAQSRLALGQLCAYEYFDVRPNINDDPLKRIAVFDSEPGEGVRGFLNAFDTFVMSIAANAIIVPPEMDEYF